MSAALRYELRVFRARLTNLDTVDRVGKARFVIDCALGTITREWHELALRSSPGLPKGLRDWAPATAYAAGDGIAFFGGFFLAVTAHTSVTGQTPLTRPDLWSRGAAPAAQPIPPGAAMQIEEQLGFINPGVAVLAAVEVGDPSFGAASPPVVDPGVVRWARPPLPVLDLPPGMVL